MWSEFERLHVALVQNSECVILGVDDLAKHANTRFRKRQEHKLSVGWLHHWIRL